MNRFKSGEDIAAALDAVGHDNRGPHNLRSAENAVGRIMASWPNERGIYSQLHRLSEFIAKTRSEISSLRPDEVKQDFIPKATDELDAIVEATASATHRIMDAADVIMELAGRMPAADADKANAAITSIYEACTFQDITGQRVTKVVNVLKVIESRIDKMMEAVGDVVTDLEHHADAHMPSGPEVASDGTHANGEAAPGNATRGSELEGPALPANVKTQSEIDAIFSS